MSNANRVERMGKVERDIQLIEIIGRGSFGEVWKSVRREGKFSELIATKIESKDCAKGMLKHETEVYVYLKNRHVWGIPEIYRYEETMTHRMLHMELLETNLEKKLFLTNHDLTRITIDLIRIIRGIHEAGIIHRDIKPENIMFNKEGNTMIVDFGLAKSYLDERCNHIPLKDNAKLTGNLMFMSHNIHMGMTASRRDDIISICYIIYYLANGKKVPWDHLTSRDKDKIHNEKMCFGSREIVKTIPFLGKIYEMASNLGFSDEPDYDKYLYILAKSLTAQKINISTSKYEVKHRKSKIKLPFT